MMLFQDVVKSCQDIQNTKKYNARQSYRIPCISGSYKGKNYQNIKIDIEKVIIKLPKIDEIEIRDYRKLQEFNGKIINATVIKEARKYYCLLLVEEIKLELFNPKYIIGVDLGVKDLIVTSNGLKYH